jgi:ubiquinone/menaquinone biosynthesis C-methylase UbiE
MVMAMDERPGLPRRLYNGLQRLGYLSLIEPFLLRAKRRVRILVERSGAGSVIEVGCGACTQAVGLARLGIFVTAVDISDRMFPVFTRRLPDTLRYFRADGTALPFPDDRFELALASMTLHEMPPEKRVPVLTEMARVVKPGGRLLIMDFHFEAGQPLNLAAFVIRLIERMAGRDHHSHFRDFVRQGGVPALALRTGFAVARRHPILGDRGGIFELPMLR